ncbi:phosphodiester glycosidase family protein [Cylindrospermopsis curvispora]|uniref:Phosphodiester glycosidase family protein n=1 Tax=Cylindrospermopsis curvispora GIHE-G1 TaxID=2666332 RepID=A0A7H0EZE1_9CYAN|nr:phosphodiester glycosidase family protein [Cylindrospermopsis curvispora]QNP29157.1 phosphodiester glycosidase family protein [Cylindrospermopsis curvispora GIHE-G1]
MVSVTANKQISLCLGAISVLATTIFTSHAQVPPPRGSSGNQITLNGSKLPASWIQLRQGDQIITYLSDAALSQFVGVDLLNTTNPELQPVDWYSNVPVRSLKATILGGYRYLEISPLAEKNKWQIQTNGANLMISTPSVTINDIRQGKGSWGDRLVIDMDYAAPWKVRPGQPINSGPIVTNSAPGQAPVQPNREWIISIDGKATDALVKKYLATSSPNPLIRKIQMTNRVKNTQQTNIHLSLPLALSPRVTTLSNPNRLVIDARQDALVPRDITWSKGLRWQQGFINLGKDSFPVVWLEINRKTSGLNLQPILPNPQTQTGTAPLTLTAQRYSAMAAINGGYFNRNNQLPLGAVRQNDQWISGPILNRGAIAWNDQGEFYFGRLSLNETLIVNQDNKQTSLPVLFLNSGYVQNGIARYTFAWGPDYVPLTNNETILTVQNGQITKQSPPKGAISIPQDGYLLILRGTAVSKASLLSVGTKVNLESSTTPGEFNTYPHIIGAGPLLIQNQRIVVDAKAEKFSQAFIKERAVRSAICTTNTDNLILAAVNNRVGGWGPTLEEHAQIMQKIGCTNALNLDGGSSTSLYLGGQLLDRFPNTAARVHNGIGVFLK